MIKKTITIGLTILITLSSVLRISAQNKFYYLSIFIDDSLKDKSFPDSIRFSMDISGLDSVMKKNFFPKKIEVKTEIELFNVLGSLGWELCIIQDFPNKIQQEKKLNSSLPTGDYYLYKDGFFSRRTIYFKLKK
jgi:hypothetical protein